MERRNFIKSSSMATMATLGAAGSISSLLESCGSSKKSQGKEIIDGPGFEQKPLGYKWNALEPNIDAMTMEIHYSRHAASYTKNMNEAIVEEKVSKDGGLTGILANMSKYSTKLRNNAGGHYNHESFWKWMAPGGNTLNSNMVSALEQNFGSVNEMKNQFNSAATKRFGSGWAWLVVNKQKKLVIGSTPNQDNPLMDLAELKGFPILGIDVWEHAYYLKYQNKRADYVAAWWNIVNWNEVESRYNWAIKNFI